MKQLFTLLVLTYSLFATELHITQEASTTNLKYTPKVVIYCINGYLYLYVSRASITQMFEESKYIGSGSKPPQPIKCTNKD